MAWFLGGMGCRNHLSYSLANSPDFISPVITPSTSALNLGSSLRTMQA